MMAFLLRKLTDLVRERERPSEVVEGELTRESLDAVGDDLPVGDLRMQLRDLRVRHRWRVAAARDAMLLREPGHLLHDLELEVRNGRRLDQPRPLELDRLRPEVVEEADAVAEQ
jgi:hypothetical protein